MNIYINKLSNIEIGYIPKNVMDHANRYTIKSKKEESLKAWAFLVNILIAEYKLDIDENSFSFDDDKPFFNGPICFNISHSNGYVGVIISKSECGIDLEKSIKLKLKNRVLSDQELTTFESEIDKSYYLTSKWTMKEAYAKRRGIGILDVLGKTIDLPSFKLIFDNEMFCLSYDTQEKLEKIFKLC